MSRLPIVVRAGLVVGLLMGASAQADHLVSKSGAVSLDVPGDWKKSGDGDTNLIAVSPAGEVTLMAFIVKESDTGKALKALDKVLAKHATDIRWAGKRKPMTLNGLKGFSMDGSATVSGQKRLTTIVAVGPTSSHHAVLLFAEADPEYLKAHADDLMAIFSSLKPNP